MQVTYQYIPVMNAIAKFQLKLVDFLIQRHWVLDLAIAQSESRGTTDQVFSSIEEGLRPEFDLQGFRVDREELASKLLDSLQDFETIQVARVRVVVVDHHVLHGQAVRRQTGSFLNPILLLISGSVIEQGRG